MRLLIISNLIPLPPNSGSRIRVHQLCRRIAEKHDVGFACHVWDDDDEKQVSRLQETFHPVITGRVRRSPWVRLLPPMARDILHRRPPTLSLWRSSELAAKLRKLLSEARFDIVQIEEAFMGPYIDLLPAASQSKTVLSLHNVMSDQAKSFERIANSPALRSWHRLNGRLCSRWEARLVSRFDRCIAVSERDLGLLHRMNPGVRAEVVPNGVEVDSCPRLAPPSGPPALLLVGDMNYEPCRDSAIRFVRSVFPRIRQRFPDCRFWIVGRGPDSKLRSLEGDGVHVTGAVDSVVPFYQECHVSVVPLRAGGGTRLKILEAMALGRPVVSTSIGAEGLDVRDREHLLIADDENQFAEEIISILGQPDSAQAMVRRARALVESRYDWREIAECQLSLYDELVETNGNRS